MSSVQAQPMMPAMRPAVAPRALAPFQYSPARKGGASWAMAAKDKSPIEARPLPAPA